MGIMDALRKSRQEKEPTTPPPQGHTLQETLKDQKKSHLFFELLGRDGEEDLAQRLHQNKLEEGDIDTLEEKRKIFSEKITHAEKIEKLLTKESVIELARKSPDFERVVNSLTPEGAVRVIASQLKEMSIADEDRFNNVALLMEDREKYKNDGDYKKINDEVEELLKKKNITQKEYEDALAIDDAGKRDEALKKLSYKTNGGFKRAINFFSFGKLGKDTTLQELNESRASIEDSIAELDMQSKSIGEALFMSVNGNEGVRGAYSSELTGEKLPNEKVMGFKNSKKETLNKDELYDNWDDFKDQVDYEHAPDKEKLVNEFIEIQKGENRKKYEGKGFLASLVSIMIEGLINNQTDKLN